MAAARSQDPAPRDLQGTVALVPRQVGTPRGPAPQDDAGVPAVLPLAMLLEVAAGFVDAAVARIRSEVPAYADCDALTQQDLRTSLAAGVELVLTSVVEQREPTAEELRAQADLGAHRAEAGLDVVDVSRAYRIGFLVVWEGLAALAASVGRDAVDRLMARASQVWWLHDRICAAVETAHRDRARQLRESSGLRAQALFGALRGLPASLEEAENAARALGMQPGGRFLAAVASGDDGRRPAIAGTVVVEEDGQTVVLSCVRGAGPAAAERLGGELLRLGWSHVGLGLCLDGLEGAARSVREAARAHRAARRTGTALLSSATDWFACLVANAAEPMDVVLGAALRALGGDRELAATVAAYLAASGNLTETASRLFVHPNTVAYRVRRLAELTGLDLRSPDGVLRAHAALALMGQPLPGGTERPV